MSHFGLFEKADREKRAIEANEKMRSDHITSINERKLIEERMKKSAAGSALE